MGTTEGMHLPSITVQGIALENPLHHFKVRFNLPLIHIPFSAVGLTVRLQRNSQTKKKKSNKFDN